MNVTTAIRWRMHAQLASFGGLLSNAWCGTIMLYRDCCMCTLLVSVSEIVSINKRYLQFASLAKLCITSNIP
jgi:hypothetical protein